MKIRNTLLSLVAVLMYTVPASAQYSGGAEYGGCSCATDEAGAGFCVDHDSCANLQICDPLNPVCPANFRCVPDSCCPDPVCLGPCQTPGNCPVGGTCAAGFPACEEAPVPAVSEWGLVVLTLIGCVVATILFGVARRRSQSVA